MSYDNLKSLAMGQDPEPASPAMRSPRLWRQQERGGASGTTTTGQRAEATPQPLQLPAARNLGEHFAR